MRLRAARTMVSAVSVRVCGEVVVLVVMGMGGMVEVEVEVLRWRATEGLGRVLKVVWSAIFVRKGEIDGKRGRD